METRASYMLVGGFVLTFIAGLIGFAVWIAKVDLDAEYKDYDIYFDGTVSGLYKRSIVFYLGIPIGDVRDISLADDPSKVRVLVRLKAEVPVSKASKARLEFQGLTGVAYIELSGGDPDAPALVAENDAERPVIASEPSPIIAIFENAPNLVNEAVLAVQQARKLLSDENAANIAGILANANALSGNLAAGTANLDSMMADVAVILSEAKVASAKLNTLLDSGNALLESDVTQLVTEATATLQAATTTLNRIDGLISANEEPITQFIGGSLPEVSRMIVDLRRTARSLSRLVSRIENNPAEALFGGKEAKFDLKTRKTEGKEQ